MMLEWMTYIKYVVQWHGAGKGSTQGPQLGLQTVGLRPGMQMSMALTRLLGGLLPA